MPNFSDIIDNRQLNLKDEILTKLDGSDKIKQKKINDIRLILFVERFLNKI